MPHLQITYSIFKGLEGNLLNLPLAFRGNVQDADVEKIRRGVLSVLSGKLALFSGLTVLFRLYLMKCWFGRVINWLGDFNG